jgi:hypothetical protein
VAINKDFRVKNGIIVEEGAIISGLSYPTVDGSADYVIATDGSGNLTLQPAKAIASNVSYDNAESGLVASSVQSAIDELQVNKADIGLLSSNITLFPTTAASDITNYNVMVTSTADPNYNITPVDIPTGAITTTNQLIASLASSSDILEGAIEGVNITTVGNIRKTAGNNNQGASFHFEVYRRESNGTEHLIGVSNETTIVYQTDGYQQFFSSALVYNSGAIFTSTDRIVIKYFGTNHGGGNPAFEFQFGGATPVKTLLPVPVEVVVHDKNAEDILVDTANFANILSGLDDDIQTALETIDSMSIGDISDVDLTTAPTNGQALIWNGTNFAPTNVVTNFRHLTDTPSSYTNAANKIVKVNNAATGLEFGDLVSGSQSREVFTSTVGQTVFNLSETYGGQNSILVYVNGVPQFPGENFTLSGSTLTFTSSPDTGSQILVYGLTPVTAELTPGDGTVTAKKLAASAYTRDIFTGDGVEDTFELTGDVGTQLAPFVYVGGILQDPITAYTIDVISNPQTITFTEAIPDETEVTVVYGPVNVTGVPSDGTITFQKMAPSVFNYDTFTGNGTQTAFTLSQSALSAKHVLVSVASVLQTPETAYTISGTTLTFSSAPANGASIIARYFVGASVITIDDDSVSTAKIQNLAVSTAKIQDNAITASKLANGSVTAAKLSGITTINIAEGTNLYYTNARVATYLTTNQYATLAQAQADAVALAIALG